MNLILVAESTYGAHSNKDAVHNLALTFNISVERVCGEYLISTDLSRNKTFRKIVEIYNSAESLIMLGYDYDMQGQAMCQCVENNLVRQGILGFLRTPFFGDEYVTSLEPLDISDYLKFMYENRLFMNSAGNNTRASIREVFSYEALLNTKEFELENPQGNSTFTYITKKLLKER